MHKYKEKIMSGVFLLAACTSIIAVIIICLFLFANGIPAIKEIGIFKFITGTVWRPSNDIYGILPMILGSIYVTAGAILIGVPIGIFTAAFMAYFCPKKIYRVLKPAVNLLAGIPSVIYGFFGLVVVVPFTGNSMLTASLILAVMILPSVIGVSETAIKAVPASYYEGALALGATHERSVFFTFIPARYFLSNYNNLYNEVMPDGWSASDTGVRECPGYVMFGANQDKGSGWLMTPPLAKLGDTPSEITVTFDLAFYASAAYKNETKSMSVSVEGPGTVGAQPD